MRIPRFPIGAVWLDAAGRAPTSAPAPNPTETPAAPPHWDEQPIALRDGQRLRAVTAAAARTHVRAGMTVAQARGRCHDLDIRAWDDTCVSRELARASAAFLAASPQVAPATGLPGTWWIGAEGFEGLGGEQALADTLQQMARLWHPAARVGIAGSCVAARAVTLDVGRWILDGGRWTSDDGTRTAESEQRTANSIIPKNTDASFLSPLPLTVLPFPRELRDTLLALGLTTCGAFAALGAGDVERRWGAAGLAAWRLAQGIDARRPTLATAPQARQAHAELAMSTTSSEPVLFLVRGALERLMADLVRDGRAAAAVAITLTLDDGRGPLPSGGRAHTITREVRAPRALARVAPWFERCRALLDDWPLTAPVSAVTVAIAATAPMSAEQGDLLAPAWRDPAAAEAAFERLRTTLGAGGVVRPVAIDAYTPEREGIWQDIGHSTLDVRRPTSDVRHPTLDIRRPASDVQYPTSNVQHPMSDSSLRLLEQPDIVPVIAGPRGDPRAFDWRGRRIPIARADGPERLSGEWWTASPFARDYWRCESDELEQEFLLYRDAAGWRLQGWYD